MSAVDTALNKLAKWRGVFAGWQLGTCMKGDPECEAVRDHRECSIMLRVEVTALTALLIQKKLLTIEEFEDQLCKEAEYMDRQYELKFPGITAAEDGIHYDTELVMKMGTMKHWRP